MYDIKQIIALDIGNGHTSYMTETDGINEFPSLVVPYKDAGIGRAMGAEPFKTKSHGEFLVGAQCRDEGAKTRSTDSSYYNSTEFKVALLYALSQVGIKNPVIVTGLPTEFWSKLRHELAANIKQWGREEGYHIEGVIVLPQHAGPFFDPELKDKDGKSVPASKIMKGKIGIIDIGHGTIDCGEFSNGKPSTSNHHGESQGVSDIHKQILTILQSPPDSFFTKGKRKGLLPEGFKLPKGANEYIIDQWLRDGGSIPFRGEEWPLEQISEGPRKEYVQTAIRRCINLVWDNTDFHAGFIVAGGGATVIGRELLRQEITCPLYIPKNPNLSIVRGFFRHAKLKLGNSRKLNESA